MDFLSAVASYMDFPIKIQYEYSEGEMKCTISSKDILVSEVSNVMNMAVLQ